MLLLDILYYLHSNRLLLFHVEDFLLRLSKIFTLASSVVYQYESSFYNLPSIKCSLIWSHFCYKYDMQHWSFDSICSILDLWLLYVIY